MGTHPAIDVDRFPRQGSYLGREVLVCFQYNARRTLRGTIVRDDAEPPWQTIIRLEDGRYVLAEECHYTPPRDRPPPDPFVGNVVKALHRWQLDLLRDLFRRQRRAP